MTGFCKYKEQCRSSPVTTLGITVDLQGAFCERCFSASVGFGSSSNTLTSSLQKGGRLGRVCSCCVLHV